MENILISIVVPIYNVEKYMKRCIDSIGKQTYKNIEIILVDDGSTDNSGKIADEYCKIDSRAFVIHKENGGLSDARNAGLAQARGKYVCFIDSDDYIEESMIEQTLNKIERTGADVIVGGYYVDYEDEQGNLKKRINKKFERDGIYNNRNEINQELLGMFGYAWNKLYRLEYLKKNKYVFEKGLSLMEDTEFNSRVLGQAIICLDTGLYNHYIQRNIITLGNKKYKNLLELNIRFCNCHSNLLKSWNMPQEKIEEINVRDYILILKGYIQNIVLREDGDCKRQISQLLKNKDIEKAINYKKYKTIKDKLFCMMVKNKMINILKIYYKYCK